MADLGTLITTFSANTRPLDSAMSRAERKFTRFQQKSTAVFNTIKKSVFSLQGALLSLGVGLSVGKLISSTKEYETALVDMGKVTEQSFAQIHKQIRSLPSELGTATQLMRGYYQTISAGVTDSTKALELLTTASKLAKVAHIDQATTVKTLAVMMGSYGDELKTTTDAANLLLSIERYGITTTGEMAAQIGLVANLAHETGLSANEMAAALAQITKSGIGTSESVTQLRSLLTALTKGFDKLPTSIQKYGSALKAIKELGFVGVLKEIMHATKGNAQEITKMLGRQEGFLAMLQLLKGSGKEYEEVLIGMKNKTGALDKAWKDWKKSLEGIWEVVKNKIINILIRLGYAVLPAIKDILGGIDKVLPDVIANFKTLWTILSAIPKGVIKFFKESNKELREMEKNANKAGEAIKNIKPPEPTFWHEFWRETSMLGTNIIHELEFVLKAVGEFLGWLTKDMIAAAKLVAKEWMSVGKIMYAALTIRPGLAKGEWDKLVRENVEEYYAEASANLKAFKNGIVADWQDMVDKMYKTTFPTPKMPATDKEEEHYLNTMQKMREKHLANAINDIRASVNATEEANQKKLAALSEIDKATSKLLTKLKGEYYRLTDSKIEALNRWKKEELAAALEVANGNKEIYKELKKWIDKNYYAKLAIENQKVTDQALDKIKKQVALEREAEQAVQDEIVRLRDGGFAYFKRVLAREVEEWRKAKISETDIALLSRLKTEEYIKSVSSKMSTTTSTMQNMWEKACYNAQDTFSTVFTDAVEGKLKSLKDYALSFLRAIRNAMAQALGAQVGGAIMGGIGKFIGIPTSGGGTATATTVPMSVGGFTPHFEGIPTFAKGADFYTRGATPIVAGEAGMEHVQITPVGKETKPSIQVNVINKGQPVSAKQEGMRFDGRQWVIDIVLDALNSQPSFRNAIRST